MKKWKLYLGLFIFDVVGCAVVYYFFYRWSATTADIQAGVEMIVLHNKLGGLLLLLFLPVAHVILIMERSKRMEQWVPHFCWGSVFLMLTGAIYFSFAIENKVTEAGYVYCESKSERMRGSTFRAFVLHAEQCPEK